MKRTARFVLLVFLFSLFVAADEERQLWNTAFQKEEPQTPKPARRRYKSATPEIATPATPPVTVVGVTIWQLAPSGGSAQGARLLVHEGTQNVEWVAQRVDSGKSLIEGSHVRLSVESGKKGFLYVVDREKYADGSTGEPYLIFPTSRLSGANNAVRTGVVIEIPSQDDSPPYFTLKRSRSDHVAEVLSVLVAPSEIPDLKIGREPLKLSAALVADWEKKYGKKAGVLELEGGAGQAWTEAEKQAGTGSRSLGGADPLPQTLYFDPDPKSEAPMMINVPLQIQKD